VYRRSHLTKIANLGYARHAERAKVPANRAMAPKNGGSFSETLRKSGTEVEYHKYNGVGHGFGLGIGTSAEGWSLKPFGSGRRRYAKIVDTALGLPRVTMYSHAA